MSISTYDELKSAIADFLNREDLASVIPTFISLAEADFNRRLTHWRMDKRASVTVDGRYNTLPTDWIETLRFDIDGDSIIPVSHKELLDRRESNDAEAGQPRYYALTGGEIEVFPEPGETYTASMVYRGKIDALSDSNADNWILTYYPDAYLYGALAHSAPYLQEDQRLTVWAAMAQSATDAINRESAAAKYSGSGLRMRIKGLS